MCPSLPGYGFSDKPAQPGWGVERIAARVGELMARLGYERYGAQGGDWGTSVSTRASASRTPTHVAGIHLMPPLAPPDPATFGDLTDAEQAALDDAAHTAEPSGTRLLDAAVHPAADDRLRAGRLARRAVRLDRREVLGVDRLRRRPRARAHPGPSCSTT